MSIQGATVRYTIDGSEPDNQSLIYTEGITAPSNRYRTIKAKAFKNGWDESDTGSATYSIWGLLSPKLSLDPNGIYYGDQVLKINYPGLFGNKPKTLETPLLSIGGGKFNENQTIKIIQRG